MNGGHLTDVLLALNLIMPRLGNGSGRSNQAIGQKQIDNMKAKLFIYLFTIVPCLAPFNAGHSLSLPVCHTGMLSLR